MVDKVIFARLDNERSDWSSMAAGGTEMRARRLITCPAGGCQAASMPGVHCRCLEAQDDRMRMVLDIDRSALDEEGDEILHPRLIAPLRSVRR